MSEAAEVHHKPASAIAAAAPGAFEYDAAISFLRADLDLALDLSDRLQPQLRVFVYAREQESVAATDGLESLSRYEISKLGASCAR